MGYQFPNMEAPMPTHIPDNPDLYQQARIALRDRTGTEPDIDDVWSIVRFMEHNGFTPTEAIEAREDLRARLAAGPQPAREQTYQLTHELTVTITTGDVVATVTLDAGAHPGTARRTLHSIIDRIADQIGALR